MTPHRRAAKMWIKCEMFSGRICTEEVLHTREAADAENKKLRAAGSFERWVTSYIELGKLEEAHHEQAQRN
jgi:hypothetical protein